MTTDRVNLALAPAYAGFMPAPRRKGTAEQIDFPQRLAALRRERNLTQQALAEMVGMGITQIKRYEAALRSHVDAIRNLVTTLRVSADELLFGKTERGPDEDLRFQFEAIQRFSNEEKKVVRPYSRDYC